MAKELSELTAGLDEKFSPTGKTLRRGGGASLNIGDVLGLPTIAEINEGKGARVEYYGDGKDDYYVLIAVKINDEWIFVPSGIFTREARPLTEAKTPIKMKWKDTQESYSIGSDDPFSKTLRSGGDICQTFAAAVRAIGEGSRLKVDDKKSVLVKEFDSDNLRPRDVYRFKVLPATNTAAQNAETPPVL